jgi:hypothetical protein
LEHACARCKRTVCARVSVSHNERFRMHVLYLNNFVFYRRLARRRHSFPRVIIYLCIVIIITVTSLYYYYYYCCCCGLLLLCKRSTAVWTFGKAKEEDCCSDHSPGGTQLYYNIGKTRIRIRRRKKWNDNMKLKTKL